ncbi:hypothetical protein THRCLA_05738 [Thraustotheca clavata]|uniref:Uncharacterized protein n=1 Tax=Thraustotheca clavata TaxID=74557 RepID=A0A1V9ZUY5_9STRA|nr:hypothetical protein THRCLA_05738 [Thraustotheca clavata]
MEKSQLSRLSLLSAVKFLPKYEFKFPTRSMENPVKFAKQATKKLVRNVTKKLSKVTISTSKLTKLLEGMAKNPLGMIQKMKDLTKRLWFTKKMLNEIGETSREHIDIIQKMKEWAAKAKAKVKVAFLHRREKLIHDTSVDEVYGIIDATIHIFMHKAKESELQRNTLAALCIQMFWRRYLQRKQFQNEEIAFFSEFFLNTAREKICRDLACQIVPCIIHQAKLIVCARIIQRIWRGFKGRKRAKSVRRKLKKLQTQAEKEAARRSKRALLLSSDNTKTLDMIKRVWACEDFIPSPNSRREHLLSRHKTLIPLPIHSPPNNTLLTKLSIPKWKRFQNHVNPKACWVAIPIHIDNHTSTDNLRPQNRLQKRHYDLQYDWIRADILQQTTNLPPPRSFNEKVHLMSKKHLPKLNKK